MCGCRIRLWRPVTHHHSKELLPGLLPDHLFFAWCRSASGALQKIDSRPSTRPKLQIAADEGNKAALNGLGYILVSGEDGESNYTGAAHYFKLAADKGHADGRYNLGILLMTGHGVRSRPPCQDPRLL